MGRVGILGLIIWVGRPGIGLGLAGRVGTATCIYFQTVTGGVWALVYVWVGLGSLGETLGEAVLLTSTGAAVSIRRIKRVQEPT